MEVGAGATLIRITDNVLTVLSRTKGAGDSMRDIASALGRANHSSVNCLLTANVCVLAPDRLETWQIALDYQSGNSPQWGLCFLSSARREQVSLGTCQEAAEM